MQLWRSQSTCSYPTQQFAVFLTDFMSCMKCGWARKCVLAAQFKPFLYGLIVCLFREHSYPHLTNGPQLQYNRTTEITAFLVNRSQVNVQYWRQLHHCKLSLCATVSGKRQLTSQVKYLPLKLTYGFRFRCEHVTTVCSLTLQTEVFSSVLYQPRRRTSLTQKGTKLTVTFATSIDPNDLIFRENHGGFSLKIMPFNPEHWFLSKFLSTTFVQAWAVFRLRQLAKWDIMSQRKPDDVSQRYSMSKLP